MWRLGSRLGDSCSWLRHVNMIINLSPNLGGLCTVERTRRKRKIIDARSPMTTTHSDSTSWNHHQIWAIQMSIIAFSYARLSESVRGVLPELINLFMFFVVYLHFKLTNLWISVLFIFNGTNFVWILWTFSVIVDMAETDSPK